MDSGTLASVFFIVVILGILLAIFLINEYRHRTWLDQHLKGRWGAVPDREYTSEELESISHYAIHHRKGKFYVDDITWNDLGLEEIFMLLNNTVSSCGEEYLYYMLRTPEQKREVLLAREELMEWFRTHPGERLQLQKIFYEIRKTNLSLSDYIDILKDIPRKNTGFYKVLALCPLVSIGAIFLDPALGVILLLSALVVNGIIHHRDSQEIEKYLKCYQCILSLVRASDKIGKWKLEDPVLRPYFDRILEGRHGLKGFRRGAWLVADNNDVRDDIASVFLSYVKIFFHADLIKFYSMLDQLDGHEASLELLMENIGLLDACIGAASYREYLSLYCRPEFVDSDRAFLNGEGLYHPMLEDPVANSITAKGQILLTGSNASGKSTFLKTVALNVILAQSIHTCLAVSYKASFMKVLTSMALKDDLQGGDSYYIVETKSLKRILEEAKQGEPLLCIVDEVLRGTNTVERIAASSRILASLAQPHVLAFAATHDIELTYILEGIYENYHFEEEIRDKEVKFNYLLRKGRATSRNAIRLLEMIGYEEDLVEQAQAAAAEFEKTGVWEPLGKGDVCS